MDIKDIAKEIRIILTNSFYKTKFSVRISRFSQGSSADITWTDGPTEKQVNDLIGHFGDTRSKFISTTRLHSATLINGVIAKWKEIHPSQSHLTLNCLASGLDHYAAFEITEFANNPDLPLYEQSIYEIVRHSILDDTGIRIVGELISNEELVKLNESSKSEIEDKEVITPIKINSLAEPIYIQAKFPKLNKNNWIEDYTSQTDDECEFTEAQIIKVVEFDPDVYDNFLHELMANYEWLEGCGGTGSHHESKYGEVWERLSSDPTEKALWIKESYRICALITNGFDYVLVDTQGYKYARYVGFGIGMTLDKVLEFSELVDHSIDPLDLPLKLGQPTDSESNLVQFSTFKKAIPAPTPTQNPDDVFFSEIYQAWVKKLINNGEFNKIKSFEDWYAIAIQVL